MSRSLFEFKLAQVYEKLSKTRLRHRIELNCTFFVAVVVDTGYRDNLAVVVLDCRDYYPAVAVLDWFGNRFVIGHYCHMGLLGLV